MRIRNKKWINSNTKSLNYNLSNLLLENLSHLLKVIENGMNKAKTE